MIPVSAAAEHQLGAAGAAMLFMCLEVKTNNDDGWIFLSGTDNADYLTSSIFTAPTGGYDYVESGLIEYPRIKNEIGKSNSGLRFVVGVAAGATDAIIAAITAAIVADEFIGSEAAYYIKLDSDPGPGDDILLAKGRVVPREWDELRVVFEFQDDNSLDMDLPSHSLTPERWNLIYDTVDNPDPNDVLQQLDAVAGSGGDIVTSGGRFRRGQRLEPRDISVIHQRPTGQDRLERSLGVRGA